MEVLIVSGMSGSGKSKTLNILEDNGFYCLDNLPIEFISQVTSFLLEEKEHPRKVAFTMDVRNKRIVSDAEHELAELENLGVKPRILFLDADDSVLLKRYKESRRLHPLMLADRLLDIAGSIKQERELLSWLRGNADFIIDTSLTSTSELREKLLNVLEEKEEGLILNFAAFGYKYGIPADVDIVFDVRCLPNPYYVQELSRMTGYDQELRDYVMGFDDSRELFKRITEYLDFSLPLYIKEGKSQLVVGLGCTGGQHRSLTFAYELSSYYTRKGIKTKISARDTDTNLHDIITR